MDKEKIVVCWSGGKDSSLMLHEVLKSEKYEVISLLTTMTEGFDRISMHGVRRSLLELQAGSLQLPLHKVYVSKKSSNKEYEEKMGQAFQFFKNKGINKIAFGDIFLEDLKKYRDEFLGRYGLEGLYPIWKKDTSLLVQSFIKEGFRGVLSCVDMPRLEETFAGREINEYFLQDLPSSVDPCGENGEFHSFVFDGPIFKNKIQLSLGETHKTERFCFRDLIPV